MVNTPHKIALLVLFLFTALSPTKAMENHSKRKDTGTTTSGSKKRKLCSLFPLIKDNDYEALKRLLENGTELDINATQGNETPLITACKNKLLNIELISLLLYYGANPNLKDSLGHNALMAACMNKSITSDIISLLLKYGAEAQHTSIYGGSALIAACEHPDIDIVIIENLLSAGAQLKEHEDNNKFYANYHQIIQSSPLILACEHKRLDIAQLLLLHKANPNKKNKHTRRSGLMIAVEDNNVELVKLLLHAGANTNIQNINEETPLILAIDKNNLEMVDILLKNGAHPNMAGYKQCTPLMYAAQSGNKDMVNLLLTHNAMIEAEDEDGKTAFDWAFSAEIRTILGSHLCSSDMYFYKKIQL